MAPRRKALRLRKAETDGPETDDPETEESRDGGRPRWMSPTLKVCFSNILEGFRGCYCLIRSEWCVWIQQCVSLLDDSSGVCLQSYELILVL